MSQREVKVVSFDVDGTLVHRDYVDYFWLELVPLLYAQRHGVNFNNAKATVLSEYEKIGEDDIRWYLPSYWLRRFDLRVDIGDVLESIKPLIRFKPGALEILPRIAEEYELIIVSNASTEFIQLVLDSMGKCRHVFSRVYSCVSNFCIPRKSDIFFKLVCQNMGVLPSEVLHVGDDPFYDLKIPRKIGIKAYLLGDNPQVLKKFRIHDFYELSKILLSSPL
ncbi:MAG: HAD family hydrolase [Thermoprotei archaeon]|nr:MAG: HAD family hydrolase [Thermoprotei archaeon]